MEKLGRYPEALLNFQEALTKELQFETREQYQHFIYLAATVLIRAIPTLLYESTSLKTAQAWLEVWQDLGRAYPEFQVALRLFTAAVHYKEATNHKQEQRILLNLPEEERRVFQEFIAVDLDLP